MSSSYSDYQDRLPPKYIYFAVGVLLGAILVALIVVVATLGEETTAAKIFLTAGFLAVALGLALLVAGFGNHRRVTASLKSEALDLIASKPVKQMSVAHADNVDDQMDEIKAIESELLRVGATSEANEVAKARREGSTAE